MGGTGGRKGETRDDVMIHTYIHTCIPTYMYTYTNMYTHVYIHTCIHTYIIHACIRTCMHTCIRTCIHKWVAPDLHGYAVAYPRLNNGDVGNSEIPKNTDRKGGKGPGKVCSHCPKSQ